MLSRQRNNAPVWFSVVSTAMTLIYYAANYRCVWHYCYMDNNMFQNLQSPQRYTMFCLVWEHFSGYLDTEGEVCRRSVQFTAVHHRVHVQVFQISHILQVPRVLVPQKHTWTRTKICQIHAVIYPFKKKKFFETETETKSCTSTFDLTRWPWRSLWWSSRVRSVGGNSRPSSRLYGLVLSRAGNPGSLDKSQTSAGSEEHTELIIFSSFLPQITTECACLFWILHRNRWHFNAAV